MFTPGLKISNIFNPTNKSLIFKSVRIGLFFKIKYKLYTQKSNNRVYHNYSRVHAFQSVLSSTAKLYIISSFRVDLEGHDPPTS